MRLWLLENDGLLIHTLVWLCDRSVNVWSVLVNFSHGTEGSASTHTLQPSSSLSVPFLNLCVCVLRPLFRFLLFTDSGWPAVLTVILISPFFFFNFSPHCLSGLLIKGLFKVKLYIFMMTFYHCIYFSFNFFQHFVYSNNSFPYLQVSFLE